MADYDIGTIKKHRIVLASELGIVNTPLESAIRNKKCIICGNFADREVWVYKGKEERELDNVLDAEVAACSEDCAMIIIMRT